MPGAVDASGEGAKYWLQILTEIRNRGVADVCMVVCDGLKGLPEEAETAPAVKAMMLAATSRDTVRSRSRTGKPARQLVSAWTREWEGPDSPGSLPMPLQTIVAETAAMRHIDKVAESDNEGARELANYFVGQCVGLLTSSPA